MLGVHDIGREENKYGGLASLLGYGLGSAAGHVNNKYNQGQQANQLMQLYGLDENQAQALSQQSPEVQQKYIQQLHDQKEQKLLMSLATGGDLSQLLSGDNQQVEGVQPQQKLSSEQRLALGSSLSPNRFNTLSKIVGEQSAQQRHEEKQASRKEEMSDKQKERINKFNKPYVDELYKDYKTAKQEQSALDQMKTLNKSGKFSSPRYHDLLKSFGLNWDSLLTDDDNTWKKLQNEFLPKMKSLFGGKVSNQEMEQFMKGIPSLTQSKEGRDKLIDMLKLMSEVPKVRYKKYKEVIKKYNDYDTRERVDDATENKIDSIYSKLLGLQGIDRIPQQEDNQQLEQSNDSSKISFNPSIFGGNTQQSQESTFGSRQQQEPVQSQRQFKVGDIVDSLDELSGVKEGATIQLEDGTVKKLVNGQWKTIMIK